MFEIRGMNPIIDSLTGNVAVWEIDANQDYITCPGCRVCVPQGRMCRCNMRTEGPTTENQTRKILIKEQRAER